MKLSIPTPKASDTHEAHLGRCRAQLSIQQHRWAVAPGHAMETPRGSLFEGSEVLLTDIADPRSTLSSHQRMKLFVDLGLVVEASHDQMRSVRYIGPAFRVCEKALAGMHGTVKPGAYIYPCDVADGMSGLLELEAKGLIERKGETQSA